MKTCALSTCCKVDQVKLMRCARCKLVHYCSRDCQKQHWKEHKAVCEPFQKGTSETSSAPPSDEDVVRQKLREAKRVGVFTGAGISVESGIPDFRSKGGLWEKFDPAIYAQLSTFQSDPAKFWEMAKEMDRVMGDAQPNRAHHALARLEDSKDVLIITQNIDGLHQEAGNQRVAELHGSTKTATCSACSTVHKGMQVQTLLQGQPECASCGSEKIKLDVILFGEGMPKSIVENAMDFVEDADVFLIIGSSLTVAPANIIPRIAKGGGAFVVYVNRDPTELDSLADIVLRGDAGDILSRLIPPADPTAAPDQLAATTTLVSPLTEELGAVAQAVELAEPGSDAQTVATKAAWRAVAAAVKQHTTGQVVDAGACALALSCSSVLATGTTKGRMFSFLVLRDLIKDRPEAAAGVVRAGVVKTLLSVIGSDACCDARGKACRALDYVMDGGGLAAVNCVVAAGGSQLLLRCLRDVDRDTQYAPATALLHLAAVNPVVAQEAHAAGAVAAMERRAAAAGDYRRDLIRALAAVTKS